MHSDRFAPEIPFPAYAFVPGRHPHPVTDSRGHSYGKSVAPAAEVDPIHPRRCRPFLMAIDLFNSGYYWEAHEVWEGLWVAAGRTGELASFLKGLIKLAAAGVKVREGQVIGVERHARRAIELFRGVRDTRPVSEASYCGIQWEPLMLAVRELAEHPIVDQSPSVEGRAVIPFRLTLSDLDPLSKQTYTTPA